MANFFSKISEKIASLADSINGTKTSAPVETTSTHEQQPQQTPEQDTQPQPQQHEKKEPTESIYNNAIDRRDMAVRAIVNEFRQATGSSSKSLATLHIFVVTDREEFDPKKYAWADDTFLSQLRLELDNAMLSAVGSQKLDIKFVTTEKLPEKACKVIDRTLYYTLKLPPAPRQEKAVRAQVTVIEGTGSLAKKEYILDTTEHRDYFIGRGSSSAAAGSYRPNDIVIASEDPDKELQARNNHVSSSHAVISPATSGFCLRALPRGCRPQGGASTKIIYSGEARELRDTVMRHPLHDGSLIELGRNVVLNFKIIDY